MTDAAITTICSAVGLALTFLITECFKYKRELMLLEQARLNRAADLKAIENVAVVAEEGVRKGETRKAEIIREVQAAKKTTELAVKGNAVAIRYAKEAIDTANGIKKALKDDGVMLIPATTPKVQEVHMVTTPEDPLYVKDTPK